MRKFGIAFFEEAELQAIADEKTDIKEGHVLDMTKEKIGDSTEGVWLVTKVKGETGNVKNGFMCQVVCLSHSGTKNIFFNRAGEIGKLHKSDFGCASYTSIIGTCYEVDELPGEKRKVEVGSSIENYLKRG